MFSHYPPFIILPSSIPSILSFNQTTSSLLLLLLCPCVSSLLLASLSLIHSLVLCCCFFFFSFSFFLEGGRRRRREEEWRVAMATASWLQATCSLHHSVRKRERDGVKERRRDVSSSLSHLCFFVFLSTNPNEKTENPTGNESD